MCVGIIHYDNKATIYMPSFECFKRAILWLQLPDFVDNAHRFWGNGLFPVDNPVHIVSRTGIC